MIGNVECKYVSGYSVFWFTNKNRAAVEKMICAEGKFSLGNSRTQTHHYLAGDDRAAKLFSSSQANTPEHDPFYKAVNQALNGLISLREPLSQSKLDI